MTYSSALSTSNTQDTSPISPMYASDSETGWQLSNDKNTTVAKKKNFLLETAPQWQSDNDKNTTVAPADNANPDYPSQSKVRALIREYQENSNQTKFFTATIADVSLVSLNAALNDLKSVKEEAEEEGFPPPSDIAISNANQLLRQMYDTLPCRFEVYPTPDGEVAIDAPGDHGRSVILLCSFDGGALCLVSLNGNHRRARYSDANTLPDSFLREALADLGQQNTQAT